MATDIRSLVGLGLNSQAVFNFLASGATMTVTWHSFVGGPVAYGTLPRLQFGNLQARILPILFAAQTVVPAVLLAIYARANKRASADSSQLLKLFTPRLLLVMLLTGLAEAAAIGPITTGIMRERHRLERSSNVKSTDPNPSPEMQRLNKAFGMWHGISALTNLVWIGAGLATSLYVGAHGLA